MSHRKHCFLVGVLSLIINIILPTFVINYYQDISAHYYCNDIWDYGGFITLLVFWVFSLFIALRELGGLMLHELDFTSSSTPTTLY